ncbi:MAG TPA: hypothetical protein VGJ26_20355 [Pirellulales bacterium]|jgi:hypothetical protein
MSQIRSVILENAVKICALNYEIELGWKEQPHERRHHAAAQEFHASYDALAFPGGLNALRNGDPEAVEKAIRFLEADPLFFRSGYIKEKLIGRLKQSSLSANQTNRIRIVVLRSLSSWRMPRAIARLAPKVTSESLISDLHAALESSNDRVRIRAKHMLQVLKSVGHD